MSAHAVRSTTVVLAVVLLALEPGVIQAAPKDENAVTVELFTSQSCSSCPPAEAHLRKLAERSDVIALEWHVDYWNGLVYGTAGRWKDPFSSKAYTVRQRRYNQNIRGQSAVYTPQAVIGGRVEVVGTHRQDILKEVARLHGKDGAHIIFGGRKDGATTVTVSGDHPETPADIVLVHFLKSTRTRVPRGENHGRTLDNAHVVLGVQTLGRWTDAKGRPLRLPKPKAGEGCAVLVQTEGQGPILAARYCPH